MRDEALRTIYKFPLAIVDSQRVALPAAACPLSVQDQNGSLVLWALVDPALLVVERTVWIFGTGEDAPAGIVEAEHYVGTVQQAHGRLVWHVFIEKGA